MKNNYLALRVAIAFSAGLSAMPFNALADAGLYDAPIPADKSLVRFVNVKLKSGVALDFSGQKFDLEPVALSNYKLIGNGAYTITDGQASATATLEPGKYYTVAAGGDSIVVIADKEVENPSKSALTLYNFSSAPADLALKLNGQSKELFADVAPSTMASKELPVIDIGFAVSEGDKTVSEVEKVSLTAKERQNVVVVDTPNGPASYLIATGIDQ